MTHDWIGWVAATVFAVSYLLKEQRALRLVQAVAALLWMTYGIVNHSWPIIVANAVVASLAAGSALFRKAA
ncbi:MAG TPA: hypothetical protein VG817_05110 [Gemmatimonadales bacterium]|nr:hypothetical protein [Gemmatimonadales bacterium]